MAAKAAGVSCSLWANVTMPLREAVWLKVFMGRLPSVSLVGNAWGPAFMIHFNHGRYAPQPGLPTVVLAKSLAGRCQIPSIFRQIIQLRRVDISSLSGKYRGSIGFALIRILTMNATSNNSRLHKHRRKLQRLIEAHNVASDEETRAKLLMLVRTAQSQFAWFRHSAEDYADPLSWVDSWRPPID